MGGPPVGCCAKAISLSSRPKCWRARAFIAGARAWPSRHELPHQLLPGWPGQNPRHKGCRLSPLLPFHVFPNEQDNVLFFLR